MPESFKPRTENERMSDQEYKLLRVGAHWKVILSMLSGLNSLLDLQGLAPGLSRGYKFTTELERIFDEASFQEVHLAYQKAIKIAPNQGEKDTLQKELEEITRLREESLAKERNTTELREKVLNAARDLFGFPKTQ